MLLSWRVDPLVVWTKTRACMHSRPQPTVLTLWRTDFWSTTLGGPRKPKLLTIRFNLRYHDINPGWEPFRSSSPQRSTLASPITHRPCLNLAGTSRNKDATSTIFVTSGGYGQATYEVSAHRPSLQQTLPELNEHSETKACARQSRKTLCMLSCSIGSAFDAR